jgi:hypothetical protein
MDMKLYRQHLSKNNKRRLSESTVSQDAAKVSRALDTFEKATKDLLGAWLDLQDNSGDQDLGSKDYPFEKSLDEVSDDIKAFVKTFKAELRQVR